MNLGGAGLRRLSFMSWVDNLFTFSSSPQKAIDMLVAMEHWLSVDWGLKYKSCSKMILLPRGASIREVTNHSYKRVSVLPVLGHQISDNASLAPDWNATRSSLWKAFWANAGSKCVRCAHIDQKMRLIERAVTSVANFRWSRWAPQKQLANDLNRIQSKMCAIVQNIRPREGEDLFVWNRRRWKAAARLAREHGLWSDKWFCRALKWDEHVERHPELVIAPLRLWRGKQFLIERRQELLPAFPRLLSSSLSALAGRTGTRAATGFVHKRWHDGIEYAKEAQGNPALPIVWATSQRLL